MFPVFPPVKRYARGMCQECAKSILFFIFYAQTPFCSWRRTETETFWTWSDVMMQLSHADMRPTRVLKLRTKSCWRECAFVWISVFIRNQTFSVDTRSDVGPLAVKLTGDWLATIIKEIYIRNNDHHINGIINKIYIILKYEIRTYKSYNI